MAWYDKYKNEKILIKKTEENNKFWAAYLDDKTNMVYVRWGRIGTKGQSQTKSFTSLYQATNFIDGKYHEKSREGYTDKHQGRIITPSVFDKICLEASIVGTSNICNELLWCDIYSPETHRWRCISDEELLNPNIKPGIIINFSTGKSYNGRSTFRVLFDFDKFYDTSMNKYIEKGDPLYPLLMKFGEAICRTFV